MAISTGQGGSTGATAVPLCALPPGPCDIVLAGASGTAWVGPGTAVTSGNAFPVIAGAAPTSFSTYPGSKGAQLYVTGSGTVSYLISTDS